MEQQLEYVISMESLIASDSFLHLRCAAFGVLISLISVILRVCDVFDGIVCANGALTAKIVDVGSDRGGVLFILRDRSMDV